MMLVVDGRCDVPMCEGHEPYGMVGRCLNCFVEPVLMVFTTRHSTRLLRCPACGCGEVKATRRATENDTNAVLVGV